MTGLEDYKVRGTAASPFLTITHYTDLMDTKDLVLVRGDVVLPGKLADTEVRLQAVQQGLLLCFLLQPYCTAPYTEKHGPCDCTIVQGCICLALYVVSNVMLCTASQWILVQAGELLEHLHSFYIRDDRYNHVKEFNHNTQDFNFKEVVRILGLPVQW